MSDRFRNKYRIDSTRWQQWDYGSNAAYFVTICTQNRKPYFGRIARGLGMDQSAKMQLSEIGEYAFKYWKEIPEHFSFVKLGEFVIMPDHMHGIIIINKKKEIDNCIEDIDAINKEIDIVVQTPKLGVSTERPKLGVSTERPKLGIPTEKLQKPASNQKWRPGILGSIINQYKRICTIHARKMDPTFAWQTRYHDHIIRTERAFDNISEYIRNNPSKWLEDQFNKK